MSIQYYVRAITKSDYLYVLKKKATKFVPDDFITWFIFKTMSFLKQNL